MRTGWRVALGAAALAMAVPGAAAKKVVDLPPGSPFAGAVELGKATGGPSLRDAVPADVAQAVFTEKSDGEPVAGWFDRTFKAALGTNGLLACKPEAARYTLSAEIGTMAITPLATGSHHRSSVTYSLTEKASGRIVYHDTQSPDFDVPRGMRFGKLGGAMGAALGGALTGQNPGVTSAMIGSGAGKVRPFDVRIDVYEGIMRGFQRMAEKVVADIAALPAPSTTDGTAPPAPK